jgi:hypothetical protein
MKKRIILLVVVFVVLLSLLSGCICTDGRCALVGLGDRFTTPTILAPTYTPTMVPTATNTPSPTSTSVPIS